MKEYPGKNFIATLLGVVLALSLLNWFTGRADQTAAPASASKPQPLATAQTLAVAQPNTTVAEPSAATDSAAEPSQPPDQNRPDFDQGYKAGYQDAQRDCRPARAAARRTYARRAVYAPRRGVAGARYYAREHHGHSTRNMILTIAAPAALGAGIGAIAGGGKGAGIGALIGGGGGALYHLIRHRRD